ncbi:MAG: LysR family transcriptional regulator [Oscillospiraceae bacterium]|jgi:DNA-binding transcriptional LysR family regulator|nr:LysR family transcriptional regulator [Oscillospiraceae bacterium]MCI8759116.1 LysR family transcriptional regulator [Oscillospiraceae bacterium]
MGNINLKQLEIFAAVVECGSFTEAANQLYMAQSTVSSHIHALEAILLTPLFHRGAKKNGALTDDGKRVYQLAKDVLQKCRDLETGMVEEKGSELRLGASTAPGCQLVPSYVAAFCRRRPGCCVSLKHGDSGGIQEMLLEREIQLGFVGSADNRQELSYECIAKDRLVLIAPCQERYAAMRAEGRLGRELLTEPLLSREYGSGTQEMVDNYLTGAQLPAGGVRVAAYVSNPVTLQKLVAEGMGVAIVSYLTVQERVAAGEVLAFELEERPVERNIYIAWRTRGELSKAAKEFLAFVRRSAEEG